MPKMQPTATQSAPTEATMTYTAYASESGIEVRLNARTLIGAKREASAWINFGGGSVTISCDGNPVATREFWQSLNNFGWDRWVAA